MKKTKKIYNFCKNVLVSILAICLCLILAELVLRFTDYKPFYYYPKGLFKGDAELGYKLTPDFKAESDLGEFCYGIKINSNGLRDNDYLDNQEAATVILGLGDSFTFGTGVDFQDSYLYQLEELLQDKEKNFKVINAGVPGYGTKQEIEFLKKCGEYYSPDIILVGFTISNDPYDNLYNPEDFTVKDGFLIETKSQEERLRTPKFYYLKSFLRRHSYLYSFVTNRLKGTKALRAFFRKSNVAVNVFPIELQFYNKAFSPTVEECYRATYQALDELKDHCELIGTRPLIIGIPTQTQINPRIWKKVQHIYGLEASNYDLDLPNKVIAEICKEAGVEYFDLLPALRSVAQNGQQPYFEIDGHWNQLGHRLAAESICSFMKDNDYI